MASLASSTDRSLSRPFWTISRIDARVVAVELNRVVVRRQSFDQTLVQANAEVEIVAFVGGG